MSITSKKSFLGRDTYVANIGGIMMGGNFPVVVQSMTDTPTTEVQATVDQIIELVEAGSKIVRITVDSLESAKAVPKIKDELLRKNVLVPLVGCLHYNGHELLKEVHECTDALDKYRVNPGNVGFGRKKDKNFTSFLETVIRASEKSVSNGEQPKSLRIGVNWGSLDQQVLNEITEKNLQDNNPKNSEELIQEALIESALQSAIFAETLGFPKEQIVISCKTSKMRDLVTVYEELAKRSRYALHLGLTEAGSGREGFIKTATALSVILDKGIGDTIRASITPSINQSRADEVRVCYEVLQSMEFIRHAPSITSCPGCGRAADKAFKELSDRVKNYVNNRLPEWKKINPDIAELEIAVMGCIVNGPGESKKSHIGISMPGKNEADLATVFADGERLFNLRGDIGKGFERVLESYITARYANRMSKEETKMVLETESKQDHYQ